MYIINMANFFKSKLLLYIRENTKVRLQKVSYGYTTFHWLLIYIIYGIKLWQEYCRNMADSRYSKNDAVSMLYLGFILIQLQSKHSYSFYFTSVFFVSFLMTKWQITYKLKYITAIHLQQKVYSTNRQYRTLIPTCYLRVH